MPSPLEEQAHVWDQLEPMTLHAEGGRWVADTFMRRVRDGWLRVIRCEEPQGWHLSISFAAFGKKALRYPSWDEIAAARYDLLPGHLDFVMHLPAVDEYVDVHATTFHLHEHPERRVRR